MLDAALCGDLSEGAMSFNTFPARTIFRPALAWICGLWLFCLNAVSGAAAADAIATGTFWQLGTARLASWKDEELAAEVMRVKEAGMDTIIIQYSAIWDTRSKTYRTFVPNSAIPLFEEAKNRDPLGAVFQAAEEENVKIIIGDFLVPPDLRYGRPDDAFSIWLSPEAIGFRRQMIARFRNSPSFAGYYIANEPDPHRVQDAMPKWLDATRALAQFVKKEKRGLPILHPIGLYAERHTNEEGKSLPSAPSPAYLERFWRPWIEGIPEIDIWMMIDGIGTGLSHLAHTSEAQEWGRSLVHGAGKEFWVDVENADMNRSRGYHAFTMERLRDSLRVAARHADKIVLFEHLNYMSPNSPKPASRDLYHDYLTYRQNRK